MVMSGDLNGSNSLFGGRCISWMDEEAAIFASCQMGTHRHVTAGISKINFDNPAKEGDIIEIGCEVIKFGRTSITLTMIARNKNTKIPICTIDEIVFVAINPETGKPTPHGVTEEKED